MEGQIFMQGASFDALLNELRSIVREEMQQQTGTGVNIEAEVITRAELCKRLNISEPTAIKWQQKGKIPYLQIGSHIRYNWQSVLTALEKKS